MYSVSRQNWRRCYGPVWQDPCAGLCEVGFCFVSDLGWRLQDKLRDLLHRSRHAFNPKGEDVDLLPGGMVDLIFDTMHICLFDVRERNSGCAVQYKLSAQSLRLFNLDDDVNDAHRAGANRLQNTNKNTLLLGLSPVFKAPDSRIARLPS